ncbi:hypothetical protein F4680DRAFT_275948 [Xylaria scruposa]|nr:hypothetical protein F4680DRAFT_275948 [Xylaria scruposa]
MDIVHLMAKKTLVFIATAKFWLTWFSSASCAHDGGLIVRSFVPLTWINHVPFCLLHLCFRLHSRACARANNRYVEQEKCRPGQRRMEREAGKQEDGSFSCRLKCESVRAVEFQIQTAARKILKHLSSCTRYLSCFPSSGQKTRRPTHLSSQKWPTPSE